MFPIQTHLGRSGRSHLDMVKSTIVLQNESGSNGQVLYCGTNSFRFNFRFDMRVISITSYSCIVRRLPFVNNPMHS
jgi:hypothetical protein